jgi:hypothetical protein
MHHQIHYLSIPVAIIFLGILSSSVLAQDAAATDTGGDAAFLFAYHPKQGARALFQEGYRRHLEWHEQREDSLPWYAWWVVTGDRTGMFVDGTFGITFSAFDARIDPQGDGADFAQTTAPFADPAFRRVLRLRRDLSTVTRLESRSASRLLQVSEVRLRPGGNAEFENVLRAVREAQSGSASLPAYTWYELIDGGQRPTYLLMVPAESWSDLASSAVGLSGLIAETGQNAEAGNRRLADLVESVVAETWSWAQNLTYLPGEGRERTDGR